MKTKEFTNEEGNVRLFKVNEMGGEIMELELDGTEFLLLQWYTETSATHSFIYNHYRTEYTELKNDLWNINRACARLLFNNFKWSKYDFRTTYYFEKNGVIKYVPIDVVATDFSKIKDLVYNEIKHHNEQ